MSAGILVGSGGLVNASTDNTIGGTDPADRNVISGHANGNVAIFIQDGSNGNKVFGNYIGTNAAGTAAIPNAIGIEIFNATGNVIGAVGSGRNIISGNNDDGISLNGIPAPGNNQIVGNYIGLQPDGITPLGNNGDGIFMGNPGVVMNIIGPGNVISANSDGIQLDQGASNNQIIGNIIGLDAGGTIDLGNSGTGIQIGAATNDPTLLNTIGGTTAADRNIISGNGDNGIQLQDGAANNQILGNYIGTNAAGTAAIPNMPNGILFTASAGMGNNVGSSTPGSGNLISGNQQDGIFFGGGQDIGTSIKRNLIGLAAGGTTASTSGVPNGQHGIEVSAALTNLTIGRSEGGASPSGEGNLIAFNTLDGIFISATGPARVLISENSIFSNTRTRNRPLTQRTGTLPKTLIPLHLNGPNGQQNFPVTYCSRKWECPYFRYPHQCCQYQFHTRVLFECYRRPHLVLAKGERSLEPTTVTTDAGGNASFFVTFAATCLAGEVVTATATRSVAGVVDVTSEFSQARSCFCQLQSSSPASRHAVTSVELSLNGAPVTRPQTSASIFTATAAESANGSTQSLIAGSALMLGAEAKLLSGNSYRWWDARTDARGSTYWVESIDLNGTSEWHGPFGVRARRRP